MPMPSLMLALLSAAARAPDFSGIWLADLDTQSLPAHPDVYLVAHRQYRCDSCEPPRDYPADGRPHPVPGDANVTSESVTIAGARTIVTRIVGPALTRETRMTVARD